MAGVVLWDLDATEGPVVEPETRMNATFEALNRLRYATTFADLVHVDLPEWARNIVDAAAENLEEDEGPVTDDTPWSFPAVEEWVVERFPMPHDAESVSEWIGRDFLAKHAHIGGGSPGGNINGYDVHDADVFLAELSSLGYELKRYHGLMNRYWSMG